jgi:hypothetical protein
MTRKYTKQYSTEERFWQKFVIEPENGCWLWTSALNNRGYGLFQMDRIAKSAHKFAFEKFYHKILSGLVIDHVCKIKRCVNPTHMRLMTSKQNLELYYQEMGWRK